jgi:cobaltochelatase CobT
VIKTLESYTDVQLTAIGIGHDVTRYYDRAVTIMDAEQLGGTMMDRLAELFDDDMTPNGARTRRKKRAA